MRNLHIYLQALAVLYGASEVQALGHRSSHFRDLQAFPKFEVQFLNNLPIAESDAQRCMSVGIEVEDEWMALYAPSVGQQRLGDGEEVKPAEDRLDLIRMALAPPGAELASPYLCLMPHRNTTSSQVQPTEDTEVAIDPVSSWAALSHLDGKCLYTRQGWFTYSYCHNQAIRQFRAAPHAHPHPPGGYIPTEDPKQDAYTLGRVKPSERNARGGITDGRKGHQQQAHAVERHKAKLPKSLGGADQAHPPPSDTPPASEGDAPAAAMQRDSDNVSPAQAPPPHASSITSSTLGAPSRYLVQRWSDGTLCDKTGRPRETEIQIHCDMSTTDRIYQIKELAVCSYLVIIHSPHLCALPGFKAPTDDVQPAAIRCRRVLDDDEFEDWLEAKREEEQRFYGGAGKREAIDGQGDGNADSYTGGPGVWPALRPEGMERVYTPLIAPPSPPSEADTGPSLKELLLQALQRKAEAERSSDPNAHHGAAAPGLTPAEEDAAREATGASGSGQAWGDEGQEEEIMFISLEQDEDGHTAIYVEASGDNGLDGDGQEKIKNIADDQRELILNAVKDFLAASEKDKKGRKGKKAHGAREVEDERQTALGQPRDEL